MAKDRKQGAAKGGTYWTLADPEKRESALYVNGEIKARAWEDENAAFAAQGTGRPQLFVNVPFSAVIFDEVEKTLGIPRVEEFRAGAALDYRAQAEQRAKTFSAKYPGDAEPLHYLEESVAILDQAGARGGTLPAAAKARVHIEQALKEFRDGRFSPDGEHQVRSARAAFASGELANNDEGRAHHLVAKAEQCINGRERSTESGRKDDAISRAVARVKAKEAEKASREAQDKGREIGD